MDLLLYRDPDIPPAPDHLYGKLEVHGAAGMLLLTLQTIERAWLPAPNGRPGGAPGLSCVPAGWYTLELHDSLEHPHTHVLVNPVLAVYAKPGDIPAGEWGRSECLIHSGNFASQSEGCILVGLARSTLTGIPDITDSKKALSALRSVLPWTLGHSLTIVEP